MSEGKPEKKFCMECGDELSNSNRKYDHLCDLCWFDWEIQEANDSN